MKTYVIGLGCLLLSHFTFAQETYKEKKITQEQSQYVSEYDYDTKVDLKPHKFGKKPKNIILMIGDGMGISQITAGYVANGGNLFLENFPVSGFMKTSSANAFTTDSAAGGTAIASGQKTNNGAIGVDVNDTPIKSILHYAEEKKMSTGLVSTSAITHATPASFIAHVPKRSQYEDIAEDFLDTDIDLFIGGGKKHFENREDGQNLLEALKAKGYQLCYDIEDFSEIQSGKLAALTAPEHNGRVHERGNMLELSTAKSIDILSQNRKGYFLMVEGSQIDWGGHQNSVDYIVEEMIDFDKSVGVALQKIANDKETLIIVTADHETSGMAVKKGNPEKRTLDVIFSSKSHTPVMVPIFAVGPGAEHFSGIMDNTELFEKMYQLLIEQNTDI